MCGINGLVGRGDRSVLERMTRLQSHRGPDDEGVWAHRGGAPWAGLGSRRLAIQDLSPAGHMPMSARDGRLWIAYNGEVYNAPELRTELEAKGEVFSSTGDTEVVLKLYAREGPSCLSRLNGIFAFAVCDLRSGRPELLLARDPMGVKPLYYEEARGGLAFASELKSLLELDDVRREMDPSALERFLAFLWVPEPDTVFRSIKKLPAGHYGAFKDGCLTLTRYWDPTYPPEGHRFRMKEAELAEELRARFFATVKAQTLSDVPVGAFLSAGLDSSSILAAMAAASSRPVSTYTITFPQECLVGETNLDDAAVAARTAARFGARHNELIVRPDVASLLPKLLWHMDEPVADPALITAYSVCREARVGSTVLLGGVGGDELFGGYRKYQAGLAGRRYRLLPSWLRRGLIEPGLRALPTFSGTRLKGYVRWARKYGASASLPLREQFIADGTYLDESERRVLAPGFAGVGASRRHDEAFARVAHADPLAQMLYADMKLFMPSLNLNYNDKMGMAASVEVRVPFLDHELADWVAWNIPPSLKLKGWTTKHILRRAMRGFLPDEVLSQPKASFGAPVGYWLENDLKDMTDDILSQTRLKARGWLEPAAVRVMIAEHRARKRDWGMQIWQFLTLELWAQQFLDRVPARTA